MPQLNRNITAIIASIIGITLLAIYSYTAAPTIAGYGDSNEIITTANILGVAHPSGYPITIILVNLFGQLPLPGNFAYHANLLAGLLHALGALSMYLVCLEFLRQLFPNSSSKQHHLTASLASLTLGLSALYWLYASVIEVNALNSFLAGVVMYAALRWRRSINEQAGIKSEITWLTLTLITFGVGLSNVQTFILLLPGLLYLFALTLTQEQEWETYLKAPRLMLCILMPIIVFFSINLLLFTLNGNKADFSWHFENDFSGWWRMISRADYRGYIPEQDRDINAYVASKDLGHYLTGAWGYLNFLIQHYTLYGVTLGVIGIIWISKKRQSLSYFPLILWLISGLWFASYMSQPADGLSNLQFRSEMGIIHRQYLLGYVSWTLLIAIGVHQLIDWSQKNTNIIKRATIIILILLLPFHALITFPMGNQRHNNFSQRHAQLLLDSAEPDSAIICFSDISCFSLLYLQLVENYRPDVTVLIKNEKYQKYFHERNPEYLGYYYDSNPNFTADLISWNVAHRPTYLAEPNGFYITYLGLEGNPFYLIPKNDYLFQIVTQIPQSLPEPDYSLTEEVLAEDIPLENYYLNGHKDYLAHIHSIYGVMYSKLGETELARKNYEYAIALNPQFAEPRQFLSQLEGYTGDPKYAYGLTSPTIEEIYDQYETVYQQSKDSQDDQMLGEAYKILLKATFRDPTNPEVRLELANFYQQGGYFNQAREELQYILKHNPDYQPAQEALDKLPISE